MKVLCKYNLQFLICFYITDRLRSITARWHEWQVTKNHPTVKALALALQIFLPLIHRWNERDLHLGVTCEVFLPKTLFRPFDLLLVLSNYRGWRTKWHHFRLEKSILNCGRTGLNLEQRNTIKYNAWMDLGWILRRIALKFCGQLGKLEHGLNRY